MSPLRKIPQPSCRARYAKIVLAFLLCDRLLKPGGFLEFDDYDWTFSGSRWMIDRRTEFMTDEQINTAQIAMVVDLFLKRNSMYEAAVENRIYRKRSEDGVVVQQGATLAARDAAYVERDAALMADVANTAKGALLRPTSSRIRAVLRAFSLWK